MNMNIYLDMKLYGIGETRHYNPTQPQYRN